MIKDDTLIMGDDSMSSHESLIKDLLLAEGDMVVS